MLTALVLQLIQCVVALPDNLTVDSRDPFEQAKDHVKNVSYILSVFIECFVYF